jgi:hypothetical protein
VDILFYLPIKDIMLLQQLNKYWHDIIDDRWVKKILIHKELKKKYKRKYVALSQYRFTKYRIFDKINIILLRTSNSKDSCVFRVNRLISIFELHLIIGQFYMLPPHKLSLIIKNYKYSKIKKIGDMFYKLPNLKEINILTQLVY